MPLSLPFLTRRAVIAACLALAGPAHAAWPERPVTFVVPFTASGITDEEARATSERLQDAVKQPFSVANLPGGAGVLAAEHVLRAAPDGYTLLFTPSFLIPMAPFTHRVTFDPVNDFEPVSAVAQSPFVITVGTFGSAGPGSLTHVSSAVFLKSAGLDIIDVPYDGVGQAFTGLLAGQIAMLSASPVEIRPDLSLGKVKPLAVTGPARSPQLARVPTIAETLTSPPVITINGRIAPAGGAAGSGGHAIARNRRDSEKPRVRHADRHARRRADRQHAGGVCQDHCERHRFVARYGARSRIEAAMS